MGVTLRARDFDVIVAEVDTTRNASALDKAIRDFCSEGGPEAVNLVFFSGHGFSVDDKDWIVPAGVSRHDASESPSQRVQTDISATIEKSGVGLVLFIIDACRDPDDQSTAKGGVPWSHGRRETRENRFIRFFGCGGGEVCHVLRNGDEGRDVSVFTKALARALAPGTSNETLQQLLTAVQDECEVLAQTANPRLAVQKPCYDIGDISSETLGQLGERLFRRSLSDSGMSPRRVWASFDPTKLHCAVITSESELNSQAKLSDRMRSVWPTGGVRIWKAFRGYWEGRRLVNGEERALASTFSRAAVTVLARSVIDAFRTQDALDETIRAVTQADLVLFDVTNFEPAVMFLMGIRAATRRGVTVCSHGGGWHAGKPLEIPFEHRRSPTLLAQ